MYIFLERSYPRRFAALAIKVKIANLIFLTQKFLLHQLNEGDNGESLETSLSRYDLTETVVHVFHSAVAIFHAPSDVSGIGGMRREHIRATPSWRKGQPRYDTVFVETDSTKSGMRGMHIARVFLFFSFTFNFTEYPCALIQWFEAVDDTPDDETGMWVVEPEILDNGAPFLAVIHVDCILRAAHLIPVYGEDFVQERHEINPSTTLDNFTTFYVNKYVDSHANEIAF